MGSWGLLKNRTTGGRVMGLHGLKRLNDGGYDEKQAKSHH